MLFQAQWSFDSPILTKVPLSVTKFPEVCLYENMFKVGLRLPFHPLVQDFLFCFNLAPSQSKPNGWKYYISCYILWPLGLGEGTVLTVKEFLAVYCPIRYD
jgi:hypothetical protein